MPVAPSPQVDDIDDGAWFRISDLMRHLNRSLSVLLVAAVLAGTSLRASAPNLSGHWIPTDLDRARQAFDVGLSDVGPAGFTIAQNDTAITLTRQFVTTYTLGTDAARWNGETLVLVTTFANSVARASYSLDNDILRVETTATTALGVTNRVVQTYRRDR